MADYTTANMNLCGQPIAGRRQWQYEDTGPVADVQEVAGFVSDAADKGMKVGDYITYTDTTRKYVYGINVNSIQTSDTGGNIGKGTLGLAVLISDTS